jgi:hypothetical protein
MMFNEMIKRDLYIKIFVIVMAIAQPMIILLVCGEDIKSISSSWQTNLQPLFIITNAITSYLFFDIPKWKIPAFLLLTLTAFSVDFTPIFHNIVATLFFLSCIYPLTIINRLKYYVYIYLFSLVIWLKFRLFWFEVWGIYTLCCYHLHFIWHKYKVLKR